MRPVLLLVLAACGRLGFDERLAEDAPGDAPGDAMFVAPSGEADPDFGTAGMTVVAAVDGEVSLHGVTDRDAGYLGIGVFDAKTTAEVNFGLFAFGADGLPAPSFGAAGVARIGPTGDDFGYGILRIDADRLIVVGDGQFPTPSTDELTLGLIDNAGVVDPSFGTGGFLRVDVAGANRQDTVYRTVRAGTELIACGVAGYNLVDSQLVLIRYDLTGALVPTFGVGGQVTDDFSAAGLEEYRDAAVLGDQLIAVGHSSSRFLVAAYDAATGARVQSFGTSGARLIGTSNAFANAVAVAGDELVVAGERGNGGLVVRLTATGDPVTSFGTAGEVEVLELDTFAGVIVQPDGKLLLAGNGDGLPKVLRLLADGARDTTFGTGGIVTLPSDVPVDVRHVMLDASGRVVLVGIRETTPITSLIARIR